MSHSGGIGTRGRVLANPLGHPGTCGRIAARSRRTGGALQVSGAVPPGWSTTTGIPYIGIASYTHMSMGHDSSSETAASIDSA